MDNLYCNTLFCSFPKDISSYWAVPHAFMYTLSVDKSIFNHSHSIKPVEDIYFRQLKWLRGTFSGSAIMYRICEFDLIEKSQSALH